MARLQPDGQPAVWLLVSQTVHGADMSESPFSLLCIPGYDQECGSECRCTSKLLSRLTPLQPGCTGRKPDAPLATQLPCSGLRPIRLPRRLPQQVPFSFQSTSTLQVHSACAARVQRCRLKQNGNCRGKGGTHPFYPTSLPTSRRAHMWTLLRGYTHHAWAAGEMKRRTCPHSICKSVCKGKCRFPSSHRVSLVSSLDGCRVQWNFRVCSN